VISAAFVPDKTTNKPWSKATSQEKLWIESVAIVASILPLAPVLKAVAPL
jgi:hypothetical protein